VEKVSTSSATDQEKPRKKAEERLNGNLGWVGGLKLRFSIWFENSRKLDLDPFSRDSHRLGNIRSAHLHFVTAFKSQNQGESWGIWLGVDGFPDAYRGQICL